MANLIKLSDTSWQQPFRDRKKEFRLWPTQKEVASFNDLKNSTKRLLRVSFEPRFNLDVIDLFQITSGQEISFPKDFQDIIKPIVLNNLNSYFTVEVLEYNDSGWAPGNINTEGAANIKTRIGQQKFRRELISYWDSCAISGINVEEILKASHIKPWKVASDSERLDPFNGILLSPMYDTLFDRGFISFDDSGKILLSSTAKKFIAELGLRKDIFLKKIDRRHIRYLQAHRSLFGFRT
ncbi:HNH endonuclease [Rugamonas sp. CCM 8940]|uniref:HNH endonuclease n=1 Tax=Rugamonas sp. CCM 8940 TaxID=2765359 RepID=UPI0018F4A19F|nr:HNH endonuclease [Rugamonas sp. CCM 8940]MBJ7312050.1 HNH endonuclease [Rugamonas sp. CCM 8940]